MPAEGKQQFNLVLDREVVEALAAEATQSGKRPTALAAEILTREARNLRRLSADERAILERLLDALTAIERNLSIVARAAERSGQPFSVELHTVLAECASVIPQLAKFVAAPATP